MNVQLFPIAAERWPGAKVNVSCMKRILIGYDGSPAADAAIEDLRHAALPEEANALVMSVADVWVPLTAEAIAAPFAASPEASAPSVRFTATKLLNAIRGAQEKARLAVAAHRELARRGCERVKRLFPGWICTSEACGDSPPWAILKRAQSWKPDLIVLGSHSHSVLQHIFFGSVAQKIVAEAPCSVRINRPRGGNGPPRVIIAVDGSEDSEAALRAVTERVWPADAEFRLVTVIDPRMETTVAWPSFLADRFVQTNDETGREWVCRMIEDAARILYDAGLNVSTEIFDGDPKQVLVRAADECKADTIFLGARGLHHGNRLSLGTLASAVVSRAHCSVEIVRPSRLVKSIRSDVRRETVIA